MNNKFQKIILLILFLLSWPFAYADTPIALDSRIKTFIYSENEVFRIVVQYGYQTNLEFADGENIETISVGNTYAWQITPMGRRIFIRPYEENILTNMTIITNKRVYQIELVSRSITNAVDEELAYVVRFFYPDDNEDQVKPHVTNITEQEPTPVVKPFNFDYILSGPERIAPLKIFDDGVNTFFEFKTIHNLPTIKAVVDSKARTLTPRQKGKYVVVNTIAPEFELTEGSDVVKIYNENYKK